MFYLRTVFKAPKYQWKAMRLLGEVNFHSAFFFHERFNVPGGDFQPEGGLPSSQDGPHLLDRGLIV